MAYNLRSLAYSIHQILHRDLQIDSVDELEKEKLESLLEKVTRLQQIVENLPLPTYNRLEKLQRQVIDLSHRAEDIVDSANVNQVSIQQKRGESSTSSIPDLTPQVIDLSHRAEDIVDSASVDRTIIALSTEGKSSTSSIPNLVRNRRVRHFRKNKKAVIEKFKDLTIVDSSQQQTVIEEFEDPTPESCCFIFTRKGVAKPLPRTSEGVAEPSAKTKIGVTGSRKCWGLDKGIVNQISIQTKGGESPTSSIPDSSEKEKAGVTLKFVLDLQNVLEEFDSLINNVPTIVDSSQQKTVIEEFEDLTIVDPTPESSASVSDPHASARKGVDEGQACMGLDKDIQKLRVQLTRHHPTHLEVIAIVGMGGIGKTTLARKLYDDAVNNSYFDCVAWATITQDYDLNTILKTLLSCLTGKEASDFTDEEKVDLKVTLHKLLYRRRYLIVLDDIWDTGIWDALRPYFPENQSTSTVILTTREQVVAAYANPSSLHTMHLLGDDDSWDLFRGKVFGEKEDLDPELERLGRTIAKNCKGLPLAISVISGLLSECDNKDFWEHIAGDINPTVALDEQFSKILSLSYDHLPHHLRPCLLYLGAFSKGAEIRVSRIKWLWAAESFLKPIEDRTPEEAAEQYLEDLENRNLVVVRQRKSCGKVKSYGMHDLLNDLCIRRAEQEHFVVCSGRMMKALDRGTEAQSLRRVILNKKRFDDYILNESGTVSKLLSTSKLVRVLDASEIDLGECPEEILQLVNIRYLSLYCTEFPLDVYRLWNLETLIFCCGFDECISIPYDIWKLVKLKHVKISGGLGFGIGVVEFKNSSTLETLQTLSLVEVKRSTANLIEKIPNIKKLGLSLENEDEDIDLSSLHNLENLKIDGLRKPLITEFPSSIAKLTLSGGDIDEKLMKIIGELSGLKVLKIKYTEWIYGGGGGKEWKTYEGGFPSLQFLQLGIFDLDQWNTEEETHFPMLRHLHIRHCDKLEEMTLENIELFMCCESVVESGRRIWKEQRDAGNDDFQLRICHRDTKKWEYL